ncbi:phage terminase large subunit family protein [Pseudogemmobacter sonorensis]|uniref:phage terminase large subunit family protein n=1 Tax=Pseudogemmobacter sonorensis TaxID=2989681 RepID=UPI00367F67CF
MMPTIAEIQRNALRALIPPPRLRLSEWIEREIRLPEGVSAQPGPVRLWPFQREIADAIGDPLVERVSLVKPVRVGFTTLLTSALAAFVANDPAPILCLLPAEADCRDYMVSDVEPIFSASPAVASALANERDETGRNTMLSRRFAGGSLKIVAAKAPRNLRRHTARILFIDEADGMDATAEGSPILLAERRTLSFPDRTIVLGSTPVHEDTSHVIRAYAQSDQRIFEVPCPDCGALTEILWQHIEWPEGRPEAAFFRCPHCGEAIEERHKAAMVEAGCWRALRPDVQAHAGFRLNALVSLHANAAWGKLAVEFVAAKADPTTLQTFVNTILGQGWKSDGGDELAEDELAARAEPFGLDAVPAEVLAITAGCDVQHDRLEISFIGWTEAGVQLILGHKVIWGAWDSPEVWQDLDELLRMRFRHDLGGQIGIDAAAIDSGDGTSQGAVMAFTAPRFARKVIAIKGADGNRPIIERAARVKLRAPLFIVGVDTVKAQLFARAARPELLRFSTDLPEHWFGQFASERAVLRYRRGQPVRAWERIAGKRAEALDCAVYAVAARQLLNPDWDRRRIELSGQASPARPSQTVFHSPFMQRR